MTRNDKLMNVFNEQSGFCAYCRTKMTLEIGKKNTATKDHVVPKSKMGVVKITDHYNIVAACSECNHRKSDMPLSQFLGLIFTKR